MEENRGAPPAGEAKWFRLAQEGDDRAFEKLVLAHTPALYRLVQRITADPDETEDIVQEAFLRLWRNLGRYNAERPIYPLLAKIAVNLARDRWRKTHGLVFEDLHAEAETLADEQPLPEMRFDQARASDILVEAVAGLPPAYRTVIALRYDAGMSYQEMAEALDLPTNTVRTHLRRAKARLREALENEEVNDA